MVVIVALKTTNIAKNGACYSYKYRYFDTMVDKRILWFTYH